MSTLSIRDVDVTKVHSLPCQIGSDDTSSEQLTGSASGVKERFLVEETSAGDEFIARFRGRKMFGKYTAVPDNYKGIVAETSEYTSDLNVKAEFSSITVWEHDELPTAGTNPIMIAKDVCSVADTLHEKIALEEVQTAMQN